MTKVNVISAKKKPVNHGKVIIWSLVAVTAFLILIALVNAGTPKKSYLKELKVCKAVVDLKESDMEDMSNPKYYIRVRLTDNAPQGYFDPENLTIQVNPEFYNTHDSNSSIGALIGNYDVYGNKAFGGGQVFEKSEWVLDEVYESFEAAKEANPVKNIVSKGTITKKKTTKDGRTFFAIKAEDRTLTAEVSREIFEKYKVNQEVDCEFEVMGESMRFLKVSG